MKHYYSRCPDNPYGLTPWEFKETNCPWCLHGLIIGYEGYYRHEPEDAVNRLKRQL